MKKEMFLHKKIKTSKNLFFTVKRVIDISPNFLYFIDKFDERKYVRICDIVEVMEEEDKRKNINTN